MERDYYRRAQSPSLPRSGVLAGLLCLVLLLCGSIHSACAEDPLSDLATAAIPIRDVNGTLLLGIANAGSRLVAVGENGVIVYSDDNGLAWHQAKVPVSATLTCVAFANAEEGWAAGDYGVVLHTNDGGLIWKRELTGLAVNDLIMAAAKRLAVANPDVVAARTALHRADIFMAGGPDKPFLTVLPFGPQKALVFGAYRMAVLTEDGGRTWTDWSLHIGDPISHNIYDSEAIGAAIYLTAESGLVFRSNDQGNTFTQVSSPGEGTLFGILGTPKGTILTFGVAGGIFRSADGGKTWLPAALADDDDLVAGMTTKDGTIIVVTAAGRIFASSDDGITFNACAVNAGMGIFGLTQAGNGNIVLIGSAGVRVEPAALFE